MLNVKENLSHLTLEFQGPADSDGSAERGRVQDGFIQETRADFWVDPDIVGNVLPAVEEAEVAAEAREVGWRMRERRERVGLAVKLHHSLRAVFECRQPVHTAIEGAALAWRACERDKVVLAA